MDFFAAQDRAKRATAILTALYVIAVILVATITALVVAGAVAGYLTDRNGSSFHSVFVLVLPVVFAVIALVILIATFMKANELRGGGTKFGIMLGGRWLADTPADAREIRLKDVVEEMAIAASVRPPKICILDGEPRINAFAAGTFDNDPIIGVTAGCLTHLSREELQAIVAHEFSHILHNDTTLNTRAYAMVFGLLAISVIGVKMLQLNFYSGRTGYQYNSDRNRSGANLPWMGLGLALMVIGWVGSLAGRMVRAAIVRQREFLADSAAVQYTRNANSVAFALYKMATTGSHLTHPIGDEAEHFLFGSGAASVWGALTLTRTHPRTMDRIRAVQSGFQPTGPDAVPVSKLTDDQENLVETRAAFEALGTGSATAAGGAAGLSALFDPPPNTVSGQSQAGQVAGTPAQAPGLGALFGGGAAPSALMAGMAMSDNESSPASEPPTGADSIASGGSPAGAPAGETFAQPEDEPAQPAAEPEPVPSQPAAQLPQASNGPPRPAKPLFAPRRPPAAEMGKIAPELLTEAGSADTVGAICFAVAAADLNPESWKSMLDSFADEETAAQVDAAIGRIKPLPLTERMALLDVLVPAFETVPADEQGAIFEAVKALLELTPEPDIVAMGVYWRLLRYLGGTAPEGPRPASWGEGAPHIAVLIAAIAHFQFGPGVLGPNAYAVAAKSLSVLGQLPPMPAMKDIHSSTVQTALIVLAGASPATRDAVVSAAGHLIGAEQIPESRADLMLRMICDAAGRDIPEIVGRWV